MATPKRDDNERIVNNFDVEPGVKAALGGGSALDDVQRAIQMTPEERTRIEKEQARVRQYVDLPTDLKKLIQRTAKKLRVSESQVFCWLVICGAKHTSMDEMNEALRGSRSMRFANVLLIPKVPEEIAENRRK